MSEIKIERLVAEVFGGCNYECQMCVLKVREVETKSF